MVPSEIQPQGDSGFESKNPPSFAIQKLPTFVPTPGHWSQSFNASEPKRGQV